MPCPALPRPAPPAPPRPPSLPGRCRSHAGRQLPQRTKSYSIADIPVDSVLCLCGSYRTAWLLKCLGGWGLGQGVVKSYGGCSARQFARAMPCNASTTAILLLLSILGRMFSSPGASCHGDPSAWRRLLPHQLVWAASRGQGRANQALGS